MEQERQKMVLNNNIVSTKKYYNNGLDFCDLAVLNMKGGRLFFLFVDRNFPIY